MAKETTTTPARVVTSAHRLSYIHLKTPTSFEGSDPKYDVTLLIPKDHPDVKRIQAAMRHVYDEKKDAVLDKLPFTSPKLWNPLRDGDEDYEDREEYAGMYYLKANSTSQPPVWDADKNDILDLDEVYSGCYGRAIIQCFAFNKAGKKGFGFFLNGVMKTDEGERLGGSAASADEFDDEPAATTASKPKGGVAPSKGPKKAGIALAEVQAAAKAYLDAYGADALKEVVTAYGVNKASEVDPAHYQDFINDCAVPEDDGEGLI